MRVPPPGHGYRPEPTDQPGTPRPPRGSAGISRAQAGGDVELLTQHLLQVWHDRSAAGTTDSPEGHCRAMARALLEHGWTR